MYKKEEIILQVKNVNLNYDRPILRDINFDIHNITRPDIVQGQIVSLIGRSGIGKTQLFRILSGLLSPNTGSVCIDADLHPVVAGQVGVVPQNYILFNHRTILDNFKIGLRGAVEKSTEKQKEELIHDYAVRFELKEHLSKYPAQLSGGQRQRVSILQQILTGHKFILMDEPFSGLDPVIKDKVLELMVSVASLSELSTLIIISHDIENALAISDTAFILANQKGKEGSTITETIDLMQMGFSWNPEIKQNKNFQELVSQMKFRM